MEILDCPYCNANYEELQGHECPEIESKIFGYDENGDYLINGKWIKK